MNHCVTVLALTLLVTERGVLSQNECPKTVVSSCEDCIRTGPLCAWCKTLNFTKMGESNAVRCDTKALLLARGCKNGDLIDPKSVHNPVIDKPLGISPSRGEEPIQLKPQEVKLDLRPGLSNTFPLKFKRAEGYPVDLYYLMDLSYSMKDDLMNVKSLGKQLLKALLKITKRARIGFGSFVDKVVLPFTNTHPEKLKNPCPEEEKDCQPPFGYKHVLSMTDNVGLFNQRVSAQLISGNLDSPEGWLDAIMQVASCGDIIGWGNSTRLLVLTTDAGFHMAGDGKLGAILDHNDGQCHLDSNQMYSKSSEMDYPSVGQVALKLAESNIQPIFAVTKDVESVYTKLKEIIPKSEVGVLSTDSSNVVSLIESAYKKLSSKIILSHDDLPDGISVTYKSNCENGATAGTTGICDNVGIGQEVEFYVTVTAQKCMGAKSFLLGPLGFREKMKVTVTTRCQCECDDSLQTSQFCSKEGSITCGTCSCNKGFVGQRCECKVGERDESHLRAACRLNNGTECSGLGDCVCGVCQCHASEDGRAIYGTHCQCDDRSCEVFQNKLCGGHGKCDCGRCICDAGYEGSACNCKKSDDGCRKGSRGSVCSGRGTCECNVCQCKSGYKLPFCEECPGCQSPCPTSASCIECLGFGTGQLSKNCSKLCGHIQHKMVEKLKETKPCKERDINNCWMVFAMKELDGVNQYEATIQEMRECPEPPNIAAIVGSTIFGVALLGLLLILLLKSIIYMNDLKEFRKFENEKKKSKWTPSENPLFKSATTTVQNPNFSED